MATRSERDTATRSPGPFTLEQIQGLHSVLAAFGAQLDETRVRDGEALHRVLETLLAAVGDVQAQVHGLRWLLTTKGLVTTPGEWMDARQPGGAELAVGLAPDAVAAAETSKT